MCDFIIFNKNIHNYYITIYKYYFSNNIKNKKSFINNHISILNYTKNHLRIFFFLNILVELKGLAWLLAILFLSKLFLLIKSFLILPEEK